MFLPIATVQRIETNRNFFTVAQPIAIGIAHEGIGAVDVNLVFVGQSIVVIVGIRIVAVRDNLRTGSDIPDLASIASLAEQRQKK